MTKTCFDIITWEEIVLKNRKISDKINFAIRNSVKSYKLSKSDSDLVCGKETDYSRRTKFKVLYAKNNIVSYYLESDTYYKGILHDLHQLNTLNFDATTGESISFYNLINPTKISNIDSMILRKINFEKGSNRVDSSELENKEFTVQDNGITIFYWYENYPMKVTLTYKELKPFIAKSGF